MADEIKKKWKNYTEDLYNKNLKRTDNLNSLPSEPEPGYLKMLEFGIVFFSSCFLVAGIPTLNVTPNLGVYLTGETVDFTCCDSGSPISQGFQFYKEGTKIHSTEVLADTCSIYKSESLTKQDAGSYQCGYWINNNGTQEESDMSETATLIITDQPPAPSITLSPSHSVYIMEESVTIICVTGSSPVRGINYFKGSKEIHRSNTPGPRDTHIISTSNQGSAGEYSCGYWVIEAGREIHSQQSNFITVRVIDRPNAPSFFLSPTYRVYITGENVTLICSIPIGTAVEGVQYYKEGKDMHKQEMSKTSITHTASMSTLVAPANYSCGYWVKNVKREIQSQPSSYVTVNVIDPPPAPLFTLSPQHSVYISGENVTGTCHPPDRSAVNMIKFYKESHEIPQVALHGKEDTYIISTSAQEAAGKYSCVYWIINAGRKIQSQPSRSLMIAVIDLPSAPLFTLSPEHSVYIYGENITGTCHPPDRSAVNMIKFYKESHEIPLVELHGKEDTYIISTSAQEAAGNYSCVYWIINAGRTIQSQTSRSVMVAVIDRPPAPSIFLRPPYPVYISGENITLICSIPFGSTVEEIQYYKDGKNVHRERTSCTNFTYIISAHAHEAAAKYSCGYWIQKSNREIQSQPSSTVTVITINQLPIPKLQDKSGLPIYLSGDNLQLVCSASPQYNVTGFYIYLDDDRLLSLKTSDQSSLTHGVSSISSSGSYSCQIQANVLGREILSQKSNPLLISLTDPPPPPTLFLVQDYNVYITGETIDMLCTEAHNSTKYNLYSGDQFLLSSKALKLPKIHSKSNASYTCTYHKDIQNRLVESGRSKPIKITVIDPPSAPYITLGSPVQKVEDGFLVTLNCSAPDTNVQRTFYFFKITAEDDTSSSEKNVTNVSATVLWELGLISNAIFSCEYEEDMIGRRVRSKRSINLTVLLIESSIFSPPVIAGLIGGISLIICLTLIIWFYVRSKKEKRYNTFRFRSSQDLSGSSATLSSSFWLSGTSSDDVINPFQRFATFQSSTKYFKGRSFRGSHYIQTCEPSLEDIQLE
ncbi:Fc receptor-like protein 5 [Discoglossus pictus]